MVMFTTFGSPKVVPMVITFILMEGPHILSNRLGNRYSPNADIDTIFSVGALHSSQSCSGEAQEQRSSFRYGTRQAALKPHLSSFPNLF